MLWISQKNEALVFAKSVIFKFSRKLTNRILSLFETCNWFSLSRLLNHENRRGFWFSNYQAILRLYIVLITSVLEICCDTSRSCRSYLPFTRTIIFFCSWRFFAHAINLGAIAGLAAVLVFFFMLKVEYVQNIFYRSFLGSICSFSTAVHTHVSFI